MTQQQKQQIEAALKLATPEQLASALASRPRKKGVSRNRATDRCACGKYSKHTAEVRKHKCGPATLAPLLS